MKARGYSYTEYTELIGQLLSEQKTTGVNHSPDYIEYTRLNLKRMQRHEKQDQPSEELLQIISGLNEPQKWVLLTEAWCGDAAQIVPFISKIAEISPNVDLELRLRDENLDLMDQFLTDGVSRSIPKLILFKAKDGEVLGSWGPRPTSLQSKYKAWSKEGRPYDEIAEDLHRWYAKDKNQEMDREFCELLRPFAHT